jgi:predicted NBD/HSP70 family sugar kinase
VWEQVVFPVEPRQRPRRLQPSSPARVTCRPAADHPLARPQPDGEGSVVRGGRGGAGELGHMSVDPNGPVCLCGSRGCREVYAGIPAVLSDLRPILGDGVTFSEAMRLLRDKHRAVTRVFKEAGTRVGQAAASLCNTWNPEAIIIGGALAGAADILIPEIRDGVDRSSLPIGRQVEIVPGSLGRMASALGAVRMALVTTHPNRQSPASARYARPKP